MSDGYLCDFTEDGGKFCDKPAAAREVKEGTLVCADHAPEVLGWGTEIQVFADPEVYRGEN